MKATIKCETPPKVYKPIVVELVLETADECRAFYQLANYHSTVKDSVEKYRDREGLVGQGMRCAPIAIDSFLQGLWEVVNDLKKKVEG